MALIVVALYACGLGLTYAGFFAVCAALFYAAFWIIWEIFCRREKVRATNDVRLCLLVALALVVTSVTTLWPLRTAFAIWRPQLDALADRVERDEPVRLPTRVGTFVVRDVSNERFRDGACLWLLLGEAALVRIRTEPGNAWTVYRFDAEWVHYDED